MFHFHKWGKWEVYLNTYRYVPGILAPKKMRDETYTGTEKRQKRECLKCGFVQDEIIADHIYNNKE